MEKFGSRPDDKKYLDFEEAIGRRVHEIGRQKGSEVKAAQAVVERLFESTNGDASQVTDAGIANAYDAVDKHS